MIKHTQIICRPLPMNCLSMFDYFVELTLEGLKFRLTSDDIWDQDQSLIDFNTKKVLTNPLNVNSSEHLHHQQQSIYIQLSYLLSFCDYRLASAYVSINNSRKDIFSIGFIENNKLRILNTARKKNVARNLMTFVRIFFFFFFWSQQNALVKNLVFFTKQTYSSNSTAILCLLPLPKSIYIWPSRYLPVQS